MQYLVIGLFAIGGLIASDAIEGTEWYQREMWESVPGKPPSEKAAGYVLRWATGTAVVIAGAAIASAVKSPA